MIRQRLRETFYYLEKNGYDYDDKDMKNHIKNIRNLFLYLNNKYTPEIKEIINTLIGYNYTPKFSRDEVIDNYLYLYENIGIQYINVDGEHVLAIEIENGEIEKYKEI